MRAALCAALLTLGASDARAQFDHVANCKSEVRGTKIWMSSAIRVHRKDLTARLDDVAIPAYCECFHARLRKALGNDLYGRARSPTGELSPAELQINSDEDRKAVIACVEAQVGRPTPRAAPETAQIARLEKYQSFVRGAVSPERGIGGLRIGDPKAAMFDVLGPTRTFKPLPDGGEEYYYGPNSFEVTISISPPPARAVRKIELSRRFQGQTPGGGRIGDSRDKIKQSYPGRVAVDSPVLVVYCDGTTFLFQDGRLDSIRAADLDSDVFKDARVKRCSR